MKLYNFTVTMFFCHKGQEKYNYNLFAFGLLYFFRAASVCLCFNLGVNVLQPVRIDIIL